MKTSSKARPQPSVENFTPRASSGGVNLAEVNWHPRFELRISGNLCSAIARLTGVTQKPTSSVFAKSHARSARRTSQ